MRIDILTVLPEMIEGMINCSIVKRAQDKGLAEIHLHNLRDYTTNKWRRVDDYPFGGEAGMVMQIEPIDRAITARGIVSFSKRISRFVSAIFSLLNFPSSQPSRAISTRQAFRQQAIPYFRMV